MSKRPFWKRWLKPSTRAFLQAAARMPGFSGFDRLHGYVYARWPYLYIGLGTGEHRLAKLYLALAQIAARLPWRLHKRRSVKVGVTGTNDRSDRVTFADAYHGKVVSLEAAKKLVTVDQPICLTNLEQVIPYTRARDIIMHSPDHIVALDCPCRLARPDPCLPLDVCLIIGEPFAGFVAEHHPQRARWISQTEATAILQAEHERGHVHHAFFKDAMLGRFYAICNCCACCCGAMQAMRNGIPMLAASGYVCRVDSWACIGCGRCVDRCQFGALSLLDGLATVDAGRCMGCGVCASQCQEGALELVQDPAKGEPLEIDKLVEVSR